MIATRSVIVCERDAARITALLAATRSPENHLLFDEIDAATIVPDDELPDDVVSMGSRVTFRDQNTSEVVTVRLVYPKELGSAGDEVSILAPVGAALIGLRTGEEIEWPLPNRRSRTLLVVQVSGGPGDQQ